MLSTTTHRKRMKKTSKISSFLKSCPPSKDPLPSVGITEILLLFDFFFFKIYSVITRGAEVDCVRLEEELAGVGGPDDQLVAGEVQEVLQHG